MRKALREAYDERDFHLSDVQELLENIQTIKWIVFFLRAETNLQPFQETSLWKYINFIKKIVNFIFKYAFAYTKLLY